MVSDFHFLRPWWLLAVVPAALIAWRLRVGADAGRPWRAVSAPRLLPHLLVGAGRRSRVRPADVLTVGRLVATVALAGPAWEWEPAPFADDAAALVLVLKVTPSMLTADVQPTRLTRAVQKVHDLTARRPGAKAALVAYAGSAHRVLPLTADAALLDTFAAELAPGVMPAEGDAPAVALTLAAEPVAKSGQRGWVLWVADAAPASEAAAPGNYRKADEPPVSVLAVAGDGPEPDSLSAAAATLGAGVVRVTPDDADVARLAANARFSSAPSAGGERRRDAGYWLVPAVAGLTLLSFRRGWVARTDEG